MNIPELTAKIECLPQCTRHIIAGSMAFRLSNIERDDLGPLWAMSRDHPTHHVWPSRAEILSAFVRCGVPKTIYGKLVARYCDYAAQPQQYAARRNNVKIDGTADAYKQPTPEEKALKALFEFCPPPEML
jgi:hypothetical protein